LLWCWDPPANGARGRKKEKIKKQMGDEIIFGEPKDYFTNSGIIIIWKVRISIIHHQRGFVHREKR
jgi:hypothetical protein